MNNKSDEILQFWAEIAKSNPDYQFYTPESEYAIYHDLIFRGVRQEEREVDLSADNSKFFSNLNNDPRFISTLASPRSTFNNLISLYSNSSKTNVFISPSWQYFF